MTTSDAKTKIENIMRDVMSDRRNSRDDLIEFLREVAGDADIRANAVEDDEVNDED